MAKYQPTQPPASGDFRRWVLQELQRVAAAVNKFESLDLAVTGVAPAKPTDGTLAYADGTAWNPGAGRGIYEYKSGAWVKL